MQVVKARKEQKGQKVQKRRHGKDGAPEHIQPKTWWELTENEKWWLRELRSGRLHKRVEDAEAKMHPVQARPFRM